MDLERLHSSTNGDEIFSDIPFTGGNDSKKTETSKSTLSQDDIERNIGRWLGFCNNIEKDILTILASLVYDDQCSESIELITIFDEKFTLIKKLAEELKKEIAEFNDKNLNNANLSLTVAKIDKILKILRFRLRSIKKTQIDYYNFKVEFLNERISKLKGYVNDETLSEENRQAIRELVEIEKISYKGTYERPGWKKYLSKIDYNKLVKLTYTVEELEKKLNIIQKNDLETDMLTITTFIKDADSFVEEKMTQERINELFEKIKVASYLIIIFNCKLVANKNKISEAKYNEYKEKIEKAKKALVNLSEKIGIINVSGKGKDKLNDDFEGIKREVNILEEQIDTFVVTIIFGGLVKTSIPELEDDFEKIHVEFNDIIDRIEQKYADKKIDSNQFNTLMNSINKIKEKLKETHIKLYDPKYVKNFNIFERIKHIELGIKVLNNFIDSLDFPIRNNRIRRKIDNEIERLEAEIETFRLTANKLIEEEPEKVEGIKDEIDLQERKLEEAGKNYRRKCAFLVKSTKTSKQFYRKHKKAVLVSTGLTSLALTHATVGPLIGPSIMYGNILLMSSVPAFKPMLSTINIALAQLIGAKQIVHDGTGKWQLANGTIIAPTCVTLSLFKGLGSVGLTSSAFAAPIIIMIKELAMKIKKKELKDDKNKREKTHNEQAEEKQDRDFLKKLKDLLIEYKNSGLSIVEFNKKYGLSDKEKDVLAVFDMTRNGGKSYGR